MAVNSVPVEVSGTLVLQTGVDNDGNPVYRRKILRNIKPEAPGVDVYNVMQALALLQVHPLISILREQVDRLEESV
ncbi:DUF1659 domain-containing protein [Desulfallas sp. Bu1-1]|jgi:hypothetical protein|uniref:DUF1659 domain-containing protein n=1 Tax=Desulfallas sp. Bu1-1 TaxID=2787620 RepID=UPI00189E99AA|nr:DUF1659 domain-containing protein [Desulfallas sp. Bu1-1]MBF7081689.1 DUF1659 domain-containing protein [Desulfallas sp. Bu1-1]